MRAKWISSLDNHRYLYKDKIRLKIEDSLLKVNRSTFEKGCDFYLISCSCSPKTFAWKQSDIDADILVIYAIEILNQIGGEISSSSQINRFDFLK